MNRILSLLMPALLLAACFELILWFEPFSSSDSGYVLHAQIASATTAELHLLSDFGNGFRRESVRDFWVRGGGEPRIYAVPLPLGEIHRMSFVPTIESVNFKLLGVQILDPNGQAVQSIATPNAAAEHTSGLGFSKSLVTTPEEDRNGLLAVGQFLALTVLFVALFWWLQKRPTEDRERWSQWKARGARWASRPRLCLLAAAILAVLFSCYPVVFFGKSFATPNNDALCLYDSFPTLPGVPANSPVESWNSSDVQALLWYHLPASVVESRALFHDHQFPLWMRDDMCGVTLFGGGQSMIGDPLHWLTIFAGGAAWAWDVKFLLAKVFFAFGVGLLVFRATRHLPTSALLAFSSVFLGFFSYRFMHPAFFSVCYAPWILLCWLEAAEAASLRACIGWALASIAANWIEFNSGTAKESSMLLLCLNGAGVLTMFLSAAPWRERLARVATMIAGSFVFLLISAPLWMVFLSSLASSATPYDAPVVNQLPPALLLGLFDDLFYRELMPAEWHVDPSANFLLLIGILWAVADFARLRKNGVFLATCLAALLPLGMVFGIIPPKWIEAAPLIKNIWHVDNTFSCPLFILFFVVAGFGLRNCFEKFASGATWNADWKRTWLYLGVLAAAYFGSVNAHPKWPSYDIQVLRAFAPSPFFLGYCAALFAAVILLPWVARRLALGRGSMVISATIAVLGLFALHFRNGMWLETKFDYYVMNPRQRVNLAQPSPAVNFVLAHQNDPARVASMGHVLSAGFQPVYGLEACVGADAVANKWYGEWLDAAGFSRSWMWNNEVSGPNPFPLGRFYDAMNVRYILGSTATPQARPAVFSADLNVYESPTAWPRAFFSDRVSVYGPPVELAALIASGDGRPLAAIQGPSPALASLSADQDSRKIVPAKNYRLTTNTTEFQIDAPAAGVAVLTEAYENGSFRVLLNGAPVECLRLNHAFKGVFIPAAGHYTVVFSYWPHLLTPALWVSGFGCLALALAGFWFVRGDNTADGMKSAIAVSQNASPTREAPAA